MPKNYFIFEFCILFKNLLHVIRLKIEWSFLFNACRWISPTKFYCNKSHAICLFTWMTSTQCDLHCLLAITAWALEWLLLWDLVTLGWALVAGKALEAGCWTLLGAGMRGRHCLCVTCSTVRGARGSKQAGPCWISLILLPSLHVASVLFCSVAPQQLLTRRFLLLEKQSVTSFLFLFCSLFVGNIARYFTYIAAAVELCCLPFCCRCCLVPIANLLFHSIHSLCFASCNIELPVMTSSLQLTSIQFFLSFHLLLQNSRGLYKSCSESAKDSSRWKIEIVYGT